MAGRTVHPGTPLPVRHNLDELLLSEPAERIADQRVSEVVVHTPLYDPECAARRRLLGKIATSCCRPQRYRLLCAW